MLEAAAQGFSTASELAVEIFRHTGLPHRLAHSVVAHTVTRALDAGMVATDVTAAFVEEVAMAADSAVPLHLWLRCDRTDWMAAADALRAF